VRRSRRFKPLDALWFAAGRKPYRCRDCRTRFYRTDSAAVSRSSRRQARSEKRRAVHFSTRLRRKVLQAAVFLLMLLIFLVFLRYITQERYPSSAGVIPCPFTLLS
jgi:hypothetical protein